MRKINKPYSERVQRKHTIEYLKFILRDMHPVKALSLLREFYNIDGGEKVPKEIKDWVVRAGRNNSCDEFKEKRRLHIL